MKIKKIAIIIVSILAVLLFVQFAIENVFYTKGNSDVVVFDIPMNSYCNETKYLSSESYPCNVVGGSILFENAGDELFFRREMAGTCYKLDMKTLTADPFDDCDVEESIYDLNVSEKMKYVDECREDGKYCVNHEVKGEVDKSGGIGIWVGSDSLYGMETFEVGSRVDNEIIYREARIKMGGNWELQADTYWGDDFLIFIRDNKIHYLDLGKV